MFRKKSKLITIIIIVSFCYPQVKIACIGNSITSGFYLETRETYPTILSQRLGPTYSVVNYGYPGATVLKKTNNSYWDNVLHGTSVWSYPDVVVVLLGTNDTYERNWYLYGEKFRNHYTEFVYSYINGTNPQVILCLPPPIFNDVYRDSILKNVINPIIRDVASKTQSGLIDLYSLMNDQSLFLPDGIHPNKFGMEVISDAVYHLVRKYYAPAIPSEFTAEGGDGEVLLSWNKNIESSIAVYHLARGTDITVPFNYLIGLSANSNTYTDHDVVNETTYLYRMWASDSTGNSSEMSQIIAATPSDGIDNTPPHAPSNFSAEGVEGKIILTWDKVSDPDVSVYHIARKNDPDKSFTYLVGLNANSNSYVDTDIIGNQTYYYTIWASDTSGNSSPLSETVSATIEDYLAVDGDNLYPSQYLLYTNYPNPFNANTTIEYFLPEQAPLSITIYDINGRNIKHWDFDFQEAGIHKIKWDGKDEIGNAVSAGIYVYKMRTSTIVHTRKMLLLK